jgi:hypothetical protein
MLIFNKKAFWNNVYYIGFGIIHHNPSRVNDNDIQCV